MTASNEASVATFESISKDMEAIYWLLEKYLVGGEFYGICVGGSEERAVGLSDLILRNKLLLAHRADQSLFSMVDGIAYMAQQFSLALYDDWEENFD